MEQYLIMAVSVSLQQNGKEVDLSKKPKNSSIAFRGGSLKFIDSQGKQSLPYMALPHQSVFFGTITVWVGRSGTILVIQCVQTLTPSLLFKALCIEFLPAPNPFISSRSALHYTTLVLIVYSYCVKMLRLRDVLLGGTTDNSHKITGPLSSAGAVRKPKANTGLLANAFQNAWKQGSLAAEVSACCACMCDSSVCVVALCV